MAHFLLQSDKSTFDVEHAMLLALLNHAKYLHTYEECSLKELELYSNTDAIPIGTIDFVSTFMKNIFGIATEIPIEIPLYLQTDEFLKRKYEIVDWSKIPRQGKYFLKDVSQLKVYSYVTDTMFYDIDELFNYKKKSDFDGTLVLDKTHLFQVSSLLSIKSEFRVYVVCGRIEAISCYEGDPLLYPDATLLRKIVNLIQLNEKYLKSYTIDVAVGSFGTALLEIHNFTSVGLYNAFWSDDLLYAYVDGINYLLDDNSIKYIFQFFK